MQNAISKVMAWNMALGRIGETDFLDDTHDSELDNDRLAARIGDLHHNRIMEQVLSGFEWTFATTQDTIAQVAGVTRYGWTYAYALPGNCVRPLALVKGSVRRSLVAAKDRPPYALQANAAGDGRLLLCEFDTTEFNVLEYTRWIGDISNWSADAVDAFAWRMAVEFALGIAKSTQLAQIMLNGYAGALEEARSVDLGSVQEDREQTTPSVAVRGAQSPYDRPLILSND